VEEHGSERVKQIEENDALREHLRLLTERCTLQEEHHEKVRQRSFRAPPPGLCNLTLVVQLDPGLKQLGFSA